MRINPESFQAGVKSAFLKQGSEGIFSGTAGSFFPYSSAQRTWSAKLTGSKLRLSDGDKHYDFSLGSKPENGTSVPVEKHEDNTHTFGEDITGYKTQVHKSSPVAIHFTIHNGKSNPTFNLRHESGKTWQLESKTRNKEKQAISFIGTAETVGSLGGGLGGGALGTGLGFAVGGPVGAAIGGALGGLGGGFLGENVLGLPAKLIDGTAQAGSRMTGKLLQGTKNFAAQQLNPYYNNSMRGGHFNLGSPYHN